MKGMKKFVQPKLFPLPEMVLKHTVPVCFDREDLPEEFVLAHEGPEEKTNWLIPDFILMSSYPFTPDVDTGKKKLRQIMEGSGITTFVQLQEKDEADRFEDYKPHALEINKNARFIFFDVVDMSAPKSLQKTKILITEIIKRLSNGEKILIHCYGGHGRTGTICGCLLGDLYPHLSYNEILLRVEATHDSRVYSMGHMSPQVYSQFQFVANYLGGKRVDVDKYKKTDV